MRDTLEHNNKTLLRNLESLSGRLNRVSIPNELEAYRTRILGVCDWARKLVNYNLSLLKVNGADLTNEILSNTQLVGQYLRVLNNRFAVPILRSSEDDRLCLSIINWIHDIHPQTKKYPAAFANQDCAVLTLLDIAPLYYFPSLEQQGLLYQPLLFHETGHVLYKIHKEEMDRLVEELQYEITEVLGPVSQRNDDFGREQLKKQQIIINTWYSWTQELFCDAVGFTIGGPCFLNAFSSFLGTLERGDFYRQLNYLRLSPHPVTWIRIQLLANRARKAGFTKQALAVETEWEQVASSMGIKEDYYGYYHSSLAAMISSKIDDMLIEAAPREFRPIEVAGQELHIRDFDKGANNEVTPVGLLNRAWQKYLTDPDNYPAWEEEQIDLFLNGICIALS